MQHQKKYMQDIKYMKLQQQYMKHGKYKIYMKTHQYMTTDKYKGRVNEAH